ncbi:unnamed protein product, partial [Amoebophrya sp. A120]
VFDQQEHHLHDLGGGLQEPGTETAAAAGPHTKTLRDEDETIHLVDEDTQADNVDKGRHEVESQHQGLPNLRLLDHFPLFEFDLRQFKTDTRDAIAAFEKAIHKRVKTSLHPPFLGLSSGYDAGAIHLALTKNSIPH